MITKKKQQSWLDFKSGKGAKKKVCTLSLPASVASKKKEGWQSCLAMGSFYVRSFAHFACALHF